MSPPSIVQNICFPLESLQKLDPKQIFSQEEKNGAQGGLKLCPIPYQVKHGVSASTVPRS